MFVVPLHGKSVNRIWAGNIFQIKDNRYVPVFNDSSINLTYESGPKGSYCYELNIVLLPSSMVRIIEVGKNENISVEYRVSEAVIGRGFIHANFIRGSMIKMEDEFWKKALRSKRYPLSLREFRKISYRCIEEKIPYCAGASNFEKIELNGMYLTGKGKSDFLEDNEFELCGFDGLGFLYFVSNGILAHDPQDLNKMGDKLFVFDSQREYSAREKKLALNFMRDSDFFILKRKKRGSSARGWYVAISFNGGLLEFKGKKHGIVFTEREGVLKRLDNLLRIAQCPTAIYVLCGGIPN
jgi:hypothetical protein